MSEKHFLIERVMASKKELNHFQALKAIFDDKGFCLRWEVIAKRPLISTLFDYLFPSKMVKTKKIKRIAIVVQYDD